MDCFSKETAALKRLKLVNSEPVSLQRQGCPIKDIGSGQIVLNCCTKVKAQKLSYYNAHHQITCNIEITRC